MGTLCSLHTIRASPSASPLSMGVMPPTASPGWDAGSPSAVIVLTRSLRPTALQSPSPLSLASTPQIDIESVRRAHKEQMVVVVVASRQWYSSYRQLLRISHRVQRRGVGLASEEVLTALGEVMEHWAEVAQQMLHRISKHRLDLSKGLVSMVVILGRSCIHRKSRSIFPRVEIRPPRSGIGGKKYGRLWTLEMVECSLYHRRSKPLTWAHYARQW